ncbi:phosphonate C-P lyase system protein PhnH [Acidicapsa acidisoli]|uniref:phosphonate C-P lyase system protein PhnH n=1 Tax=Acidicapsa acidisoli TaxID=1615681 RepID=UPI0021DFACD1|nr:phosphonate C-P lyase system protein PhnH [Acidicapsa acidisoli]
MSTLAAPKPYDRVFDGQRHFRTLLQCTARPGSIGHLGEAALDVPSQLNRGAAFIALTLFSGDTSFYVDQGGESTLHFIQRETGANPTSAPRADFLIFPYLQQSEDRWLDGLRQARLGELAYPDLGATVVFQVAAISSTPLPDSLRLTLTGPGIEVETIVFVQGAPEAVFESLREHNAEFPLGVDAFLTCESIAIGPCVLALPRSTRLQWD